MKVMSKGWLASKSDASIKNKSYSPVVRQNRYTIHPELLDKSGNITKEELLTVRFSSDPDSSIEAGSSSD